MVYSNLKSRIYANQNNRSQSNVQYKNWTICYTIWTHFWRDVPPNWVNQFPLADGRPVVHQHANAWKATISCLPPFKLIGTGQSRPSHLAFRRVV